MYSAHYHFVRRGDAMRVRRGDAMRVRRATCAQILGKHSSTQGPQMELLT